MRDTRYLVAILILVAPTVGCGLTTSVPLPTSTSVPVIATVPKVTPSPTPTLVPLTATPMPPTTTPTLRPSVTPTPKTSYQINESVAIGNWEYRVTKVTTTKTLVWSRYGNSTDAKGMYLIVWTTLTNIGAKNWSINTWDFELHDSSGIT
jgi:hypothetical protein